MSIKSMPLLLVAIFFSPTSFSSVVGDGFWFERNVELNLKFGGWSHHNAESYDQYDYNESHNGLGFDLTIYKTSNENHGIGLAYYQMKDSFDMDNWQGGFLYTYEPKLDIPIIKNLELNLGVGAMKRGWIMRNVGVDYNDYYLESRTTFSFFPYLTYNINNYLNMDVFYIPQLDAAMPKSTWFVRGGLNISNLYNYFSN